MNGIKFQADLKSAKLTARKNPDHPDTVSFAEARKRGANFHAATLAGFKATDGMGRVERVGIFPNLS